MSTDVDVLNAALLACEQPEATGPNDTSSWVRKVRNIYPRASRTLLERHPWNFAMSRVRLTLSGTTPIGRSFAYTKPGDCLRIITVNNTGIAQSLYDGPPDYEDEGGLILCDYSPCYLRYISSSWLTRVGSWPQVFADAVSAEIAAKAYGVFGKSASKKDEIKKDAMKAFQAARSWDAQQMPTREMPRGSWSRSRYGGAHGGYCGGAVTSDTDDDDTTDLDGDTDGADGGEWTA